MSAADVFTLYKCVCHVQLIKAQKIYMKIGSISITALLKTCGECVVTNTSGGGGGGDGRGGGSSSLLHTYSFAFIEMFSFFIL